MESKPLASKSPHQRSVTETPQTVGHLNSQNGIQQENKKPDWDYIIPICLCSQETCLCIRNTSAHIDKTEKDLKMLQRGKTAENRKVISTSRGTLGNNREKMDNAKCQGMNTASINTHLTNHKPLQETLSLEINLNTDIDTSSPEVTVRPSLPCRTWSDEANGNEILLSAPGRGSEEDALGSEQKSCVLQPKLVPAASRKPIPVPVPRKPRKAALACQEKVEEGTEEISSQEGRKMNVKELKVSSEGKGSSSLSVSVPISENRQPLFLSARKPCAPPAPPPRKKPYLSTPERPPTSAPQTPPKDVEEEDLGWDCSMYEMEISVDKEDEEVEREGRDDQEAVHSDLTHRPPSSRSFNQPETSLPSAAVEDGVVKVAPKKPQRHSSPMARLQKKDSSEEKEEGRLADNEKKQVLPIQDCVLKERVRRELPSPPDEKPRRSLLRAGTSKTSRSSLGKQRAKSFSSADLIRSEGQKRNSFRKLLDLKLSVKMFPKLIVKGVQTSECTANETEQYVDSDQHRPQSFHEHLRVERKLSCPLIGVEQNVDGDEFSPEIEQAVDYENIPHYEEISDYVNVQASQSTAWESLMYNDEGIYEEQEPYMSLEKNSGHQLRHGEYDRYYGGFNTVSVSL